MTIFYVLGALSVALTSGLFLLDKYDEKDDKGPILNLDQQCPYKLEPPDASGK